MGRKCILLLAAAALAMAPAAARGAGFGLYEQGGRALGIAGAYTARVGDASAVFFNPAGLAQVEHGDLYAGASLLFVSREFAGVNPYPGYGSHGKSPNSVFSPFHLYWAQRLASRITVGLGVYSPFGLTTEWNDPYDFPGKFISTKASITPFFFNPAVAIKAAPWLRLGAGLLAVHSSLELRRDIAQPDPRAGMDSTQVLDLGTAKLNANNGLDFGGNFGAQVDVGDKVTLGATYRTRVKVKYDGDANFTFTGTGTALDPQLEPLFPPDQAVSTEIDFPASAVGAVSFAPSDKLVLEADIGWTQWSSFRTLPIHFADPTLDLAFAENWKDAWFYRIGAEASVRSDLKLRVGYYYDQTPQPTEAVSPLLPDNNRNGLSLGIGKSWNRLTADAFGMLLLVSDRSTGGRSRDGFDGTYANGVQILGLSLGYRY